MKQLLFILTTVSLIFTSCKKDKDPEPDPSPNPSQSTPMLILKFKFDSMQVRLDNAGNPAVLPANHSGQSPVFRKMSAHYVEMAPTAYTMIGNGDVLYRNAETTAGGPNAIDFSQSVVVSEGQAFLSIPLDSVTPGTYQYLRVSLAYQNYDIRFRALNMNLTGTVASFIGFNTYIQNFTIKDSTVTVNVNKAQGYWAFETAYTVSQGQAPPGATTVPNPIASTSPIPPGSCLVTGAFPTPLAITGNETGNIIIEVSLSTNKSFEWKDANMNGVYEPLDGDTVVDMGIRGLIPIVQ
jgi:hypothetical protein